MEQPPLPKITNLREATFDNSATIAVLKDVLKSAEEGAVREVAIFANTDDGNVAVAQSTFKDRRHIIAGLVYALLDYCNVAFLNDVFETDTTP